MYNQVRGEKIQPQDTASYLDDSISYSNDINPDIHVDVESTSLSQQKPQFLDYIAVPPPDFIDHFNRGMNIDNQSTKSKSSTVVSGVMPPPEFIEHFDRAMNLSNSTTLKSSHDISNSGRNGGGEELKLNVKYETAAGISDYELVASGYTKKEFTQDDNTLNITSTLNTRKSVKHFIDDSPTQTNYEPNHHSLREHRSLDRNFKRHNEQRSVLDSHTSLTWNRSSRERFKNIQTETEHLPKSSAWTQSFDRRHDRRNIDGKKPEKVRSKVECVYSLLSMLGSNDHLEMSKKFHELSKTPEICNSLRRSGCIPLLVQMIHDEDGPDKQRIWASMALHNVVHAHPDEKAGRREAKVLRLLDQIMDYCKFLHSLLQSGGEAIADDADRHPLAAMSSLMKVSFDEEHRETMCEFGALQAIPNLVHLDHAAHGPMPENQCCNSLRKFALMTLTNLTFGDENNKALLCSQKLFMEALVAQLYSAPDDLLQVTASVLRNLSWRADAQMKAVLNEIGTVTALAKAAMSNKCENTLKAILSALWNLSAHCSTNKAEFCAVDGAISFIVSMLTFEGPNKTLKNIENAGGILRNVSSHIAVSEEYRQILREHNCLSILLKQLESKSLTVVSNACGTLWNLSARCPEDQQFLWDNGAVPLLRSLIQSKNSMISEGSASALKNLLNFRPNCQNVNHMNSMERSLNSKKLKALHAGKEQELGAASKSQSKTWNNLDLIHHKDSSTIQPRRFPLNSALGSAIGAEVTKRLPRSEILTKSESRDSVFSAKSDGAVYDHLLKSHSVSGSNRNLHNNSRNLASTPYPMEKDVELVEEQPIDYSRKYKEHIKKASDQREDEGNFPTTYQETDLDQPTDFSLRYAESQLGRKVKITSSDTHVKLVQHSEPRENNVAEGNEILLPKCYQTEDTPYSISNAASVTDLRSHTTSDKINENDLPSIGDNIETKSGQINPLKTTPHSSNPYGSVSYTPEKTVYYCEEGTPVYFSRCDSLSSLDEVIPQGERPSKDMQNVSSKTKEELLMVSKNSCDEVKSNPPVQLTPQVNSALETPLMFSRRSSMDSLAEDIEHLDDKSSVVSEFSRLASGVISPSEIPDSPTQSMPQSPRRNSVSGTVTRASLSTGASPNRQRNNTGENSNKHCLRSVFEDDLNRFNVENTPAQFSTATSLSNLSILDEEQTNSEQHTLLANLNNLSDDEDANENNDDLLLASCINIGMKRTPISSTYCPNIDAASAVSHSTAVTHDESRQYFTEDTPAILSTVGSNTNLSTISICSSDNDPKENTVYEVLGPTSDNVKHHNQSINRRSLNLSDDLSSNGSESGAVGNDILQQCIRDGIQKPSTKSKVDVAINPGNNFMDPMVMLRRGGSSFVPSFVSVNDETNKYLVEDSPCNFSVMSALSSLTIGSNMAGPDAILQGSSNVTLKNSDNNKPIRNENPTPARSNVRPQMTSLPIEEVRREPQGHNDSLSSLSMESDDDTNLLSQAIAAGCNKTKSNLSLSNSISLSGKHTTTVLSSSQHLEINAAISTPSLSSQVTALNEPINNKTSLFPIRGAKPRVTTVTVDDGRIDPQGHNDSLSSLSMESDDDTQLLSQAIAAGCNKSKLNLGLPNSFISTVQRTTTSSQDKHLNNVVSRYLSSSGTAQNNGTTAPPLAQPLVISDDKPKITSVPVEDVRKKYQSHDDSLSSLSIESDDDIFSQAIAAGCNKTKSSLELPIALSSSLRSATANTTTAISSLVSPDMAQNNSNNNYREQTGKASLSSEDSSDSHNNQSKSLLELCILTGMHKNNDNNVVRYSGESTTVHKQSRSIKSYRSKSEHTEQSTTQSNPNLKQFDTLSVTGKQLTLNRHFKERGRREEKCFNTGAMKKKAEPQPQPQTSLLTREALDLHNTMINNGHVMSAVAQIEEATRSTNVKYSHSNNNTTNSSVITFNINNINHHYHSSFRRREERQSYHSPRDFDQFTVTEQQYHQQHQSRRRHTRSQHSQPGAG